MLPQQLRQQIDLRGLRRPSKDVLNFKKMKERVSGLQVGVLVKQSLMLPRIRIRKQLQKIMCLLKGDSASLMILISLMTKMPRYYPFQGAGAAVMPRLHPPKEPKNQHPQVPQKVLPRSLKVKRKLEIRGMPKQLLN